MFSPSLIFFLMVHLFTFFYLLLKYFDCCFSIPFVQVGESKLVLEIGQTSLRHQNAKPYTDDLILSMALAEVRPVDRYVGKLLPELAVLLFTLSLPLVLS